MVVWALSHPAVTTPNALASPQPMRQPFHAVADLLSVDSKNPSYREQARANDPSNPPMSSPGRFGVALTRLTRAALISREERNCNLRLRDALIGNYSAPEHFNETAIDAPGSKREGKP